MDTCGAGLSKRQLINNLVMEYDRLKEAVHKQVDEKIRKQMNEEIIGIEALEYYGDDLVAYYAYYDHSEPPPEDDIIKRVEHQYPVISDCMTVDIDTLDFEVQQ